MTLFLVEDSLTVQQRLLKEFQSLDNVSVVGMAAGALEAIEGILRTRPHLVALDLNLNQGTGMDVLRALKRSDAQPLVYVVSNVADETTRTLCMRAGASRFFDKSSELDDFIGAVAALATA
jgi:DNA-binding NarL/FixJ family response regulator